ncbi:hypothetical protein I302_101071 [Kwoniella bestiolae CBS 10118]|uniref:5'-nucleotidase n=1 Tax=Kwoniella bestiolae CBS 10118 TaxID=1296100 RepID=A0A1B9G6U8_9TREE|nr:hypothetical protein I302_04447 [Kwoniella bestiolae CBS 10118]OCF26758.1 hypothetical protein I302_04447 [Kwoniella bestiolae CBS 10118]
MPTLPILCFNDVYRVNQKYNPQPGAPPITKSDGQNINVSQFAQLLFSERDKWADRSETKTKGKDKEPVKDGLVLFAGDVFNPSVESSISRGSHMVPLLNALELDVACVGNHDFDFGYPHLTKLIQSTTFPWLLSNIIDEKTGQVPETLNRYWITERCGVKIGVIGLVEQDWIATIPSWPKTFKYRPMVETALELSKELRDPNGPHQVDIIIALTHCRVPNDIKLCNELGAVADKPGVEDEHGVDLLIGGHDHIYYIGKGHTSWEGYSGRHDAPGTTEDKGVRLIKSGTDFRDLTSALLELTPTKPGSIRKHLIISLKGKHLYVLPSSPSSEPFDRMVKSLLASVSEAIQKPVCFTLSPFDARSEIVRTQENGLGNWIADVLLHAYAESMIDKSKNGSNSSSGRTTPVNGNGEDKDCADAVIICGGTLRGDSQYGPGKITLGDILEILPFEDPVVCIEIDGAGIWDTLESALSKWPAQEGRFPIVSGLAVRWDHTRPPNQRVISVHKLTHPKKDEDDEIENPQDFIDFKEQDDGTRVVVRQKKLELGEEIKRDSKKIYRVITREYMALGFDGFTDLKDRKYIVDDENGQIMSSILRSFLLGSSYIFRHKQLESAAAAHLSSRTDKVLSKARAQHQHSPSSSLSSSPQSNKGFLSPNPTNSHNNVLSPVSERSENSAWGVLRRHVVQHDWGTIRDALHVAKHEHMSGVDEVAGQAMRQHRQATPHMPGEWKSRAATPIPPPGSKPGQNADDDLLVNQEKKELEGLSDDLAIVCPLIDGRMRDVAEGKP